MCTLSSFSTITGCKRPGRISHGDVKMTSGYRYGSKAVYRCRKGYRLVGIATLVCMSHGKWAPKTPACQKGGMTDHFLLLTTF